MTRYSFLLERFGRPTNGIVKPVFFLALLCTVGAATASARADEPTAMVEQVTGGPNDLSTYDYLYPGRIINLGTDGSIDLIYFQTCLRERILGGKITVLQDRSSVQGSVRLMRSHAGCGQDDRRFRHDDRRTSAAMVFRGRASIDVVGHLAPRFETADQVDWISVTELPSALEIFRLHRPNRIVDLNSLGLLLEPGGLYRVETGDSYVTFRVDPDAIERKGSKPISLRHRLPDKISSGYR